MITKYIFAAAAIAGAGCASSAMAQEFDGPYAGVQAGYERSDVRDPSTELGTLSHDDQADSFTGGFYAGYDKRIAPRVVIGAEGAFDLSSNEKANGLIGGKSASIDPKWSFDLTTRAGFMLDSSSLLYVRGGYENARVETTALDSANMQVTDKGNRDGWVLGAGYERQLIPGVFGRIEYRYSDLSEGENKWDRHRALVGVSYHF